MPRKILVVDDKPFMVRLIQHHLEKAGYELIKARNRQEAAAVIEQQAPELVVMDDCGGSSPTSPTAHAPHRIPMIRMTDVPPDLEPAEADAADVVFTKPFSPTQLMAEVKRLVLESKSK